MLVPRQLLEPLPTSLPSRSDALPRSSPGSYTASMPTGQQIFQLRIELEEVTPAVWRRLLVPGGIRLAKLHMILQAAMGWTNSHLHAFTIDDDFGDGWDHTVIVEDRSTLTYGLKHAVCLDGANACPPEDCGGAGGYEELRLALADPSHEDYDDLLEWIGGPIDPTAFDIVATNVALQHVH